MKRQLSFSFDVGGKTYRCETAAAPVEDRDGTRCRASIDHARGLILLDPKLPARDAWRIVAQAVALACEHSMRARRPHGGPPDRGPAR